MMERFPHCGALKAGGRFLHQKKGIGGNAFGGSIGVSQAFSALRHDRSTVQVKRSGLWICTNGIHPLCPQLTLLDGIAQLAAYRGDSLWIEASRELEQ